MNTFRHGGLFTIFFILGSLFFIKTYRPLELLVFYITGCIATTFIDIDHFVIDFFRTKDSSKLVRALSQPFRTFSDPDYLQLSLTETERLRSHVLIFALITSNAIIYNFIGSTVIVRKILNFVVISVLFHILLDIYSDRDDVETYMDYFRA